MDDFFLNVVGAKIYKDVNRHDFLKMPLLLNAKAEGVVHKVFSVGVMGNREPFVTIRSQKGEFLVYRLPGDLYGWVIKALAFELQGVRIFPKWVEFGILDGVAFADELEEE